MKTSTFVASVLALFIACGVSFGAGYFTAKSESSEAPEARPVVSATDLGETDSGADSSPLTAPDDTRASTDGEGDPTKDADTNNKRPGDLSADATNGNTLHASDGDSNDENVEVETNSSSSENLTDEQEEAVRNAASRLKDLEDELGDIVELEGLDIEDMINGEKVEFTGTVSGTVVDSNNVPVPHAEIYASTSESYSNNAGGSVVRFLMSSGDKGKLLATADASGYFNATITKKISKRANLSVTLTGAAEGYADSEEDSFVLENGGAREGVNLKVRAAGAITGRVVDQSGRGIDGVKVSLNKGHSGSFGIPFGGGSGYETVTDMSGEFRIEKMPEGRFKFSISRMGIRQISGPTEIDVQAGRDTRAAADFIVAATAIVRCNFTDAEGKKITGWATLKFKDAEGKTVKTLSGAISGDGTFEINDPPVGNFDVEVQVWGYEKQTVKATIVDGQPNSLGSLSMVKSETPSGGSTIILPGSD